MEMPKGYWRFHSQNNECCCVNVTYQDELREALRLMKEMAEALELCSTKPALFHGAATQVLKKFKEWK